MRLNKIKLSGFKSFVDPTTILLPSNLVGVVGPNGCGKSNVIDAIRWVMGESSAKNLRGDSMTDVIFNGSANRKPVGAASIELYFDNADGTIVFFSYETPVAAFIPDKGFVRTSTKCSATTSRHINRWLWGANAAKVCQFVLDNLL